MVVARSLKDLYWIEKSNQYKKNIKFNGKIVQGNPKNNKRLTDFFEVEN